MSECKKCGATIVWKEKVGGGFYPPENPDGSRHDCEKKATAKPTPGSITGKLDSYTEGSATFVCKGGTHKTYAITLAMSREWKTAGFLQPPEVHADIWLEFSIDSKSFVQPGWKRVQQPEWAIQTPPATPAKDAAPAQQAAPEQEPCTSPAAASPAAPAPTTAPAGVDLLAMVNDPNSYWKAKTLMELRARDEICQQVKVKNWQESLRLAMEFCGPRANLEFVELTAADIHKFIQDKAGEV